MEKKKKKDYKLASSICQQANERNDLLNKEDQNQSGEGLVAGNNSTIVNSSACENQGFQPIVQWPNTTQLSAEKPQLVSIPSIPSQTLSPTILSQWQQPQHQQQGPVWMAQPSGYPLAGPNFPPYFPFAPIGGNSERNWQGSSIPGAGISPRNQSHIPSFCYQVGYPYPGPWDPLSWWLQPPQQQQQPPCGHPPPPPLSGGSAASPQPFHRGVIRPPPKLSQKHQHLWEAQSAENLQLWATVRHLQSELADYKTRLMKLESDVLSLKPNTETPIGTSLTGQTSKRGRPKRSIPSQDDPRPRARARKPSINAQCETKELNFERKELNSGTHLAFNTEIHNDINTLQMSSIVHNSSESKRNSDRTEESKSSKGLSDAIIGTTNNNGNFGWPSNCFVGWNYGNGDQDDLENAALGSPKDEDGDMEDDDISNADIG